MRKLYGLFIYKLQYTSFFSIMQRFSAFLVLFMFYVFFLGVVFLNNFINYNSFYNFFYFVLLFIFIFYFVFHFINGLRIYLVSLYYNYNLEKNALILDSLYILKLMEKSNFIKNMVNSFINFKTVMKTSMLKSNNFFLTFIILISIIVMLLVVVV